LKNDDSYVFKTFSGGLETMPMSTQFVMITGMFRSGTTLLNRILNAHPDVLMVTDAFLHFFKRLRDVVYIEKAGPLWRPGGPLEDGFLDTHTSALEALRELDLNRPLTPEDRRILTEEIDETTSRIHPDLLSGLADVKAATFREHFKAMLKVAADVYASGKRLACLGFKMSWLEYFIPAMARSFPDMRFIMPYRDVRAVAASQNMKAEKRPLLFYARQWRKSVAGMIAYTRLDPALARRIHPVRYEALVQDPEFQIRSLCRLLGVDFHPAMLDTHAYREERGKPWQSNSSYDIMDKGFYLASIDRWKQALKEEEAGFLEWLCGPELALLGYAPFVKERQDPAVFFSRPPEPKVQELVPWVQDDQSSAYITNGAERARQLGFELARRHLLETEESCLANDHRNHELLQSVFLFPELYPLLQASWKAANPKGWSS
jgi:hypothetical protein